MRRSDKSRLEPERAAALVLARVMAISNPRDETPARHRARARLHVSENDFNVVSSRNARIHVVLDLPAEKSRKAEFLGASAKD